MREKGRIMQKKKSIWEPRIIWAHMHILLTIQSFKWIMRGSSIFVLLTVHEWPKNCENTHRETNRIESSKDEKRSDLHQMHLQQVHNGRRGVFSRKIDRREIVHCTKIDGYVVQSDESFQRGVNTPHG